MMLHHKQHALAPVPCTSQTRTRSGLGNPCSCVRLQGANWRPHQRPARKHFSLGHHSKGELGAGICNKHEGDMANTCFCTCCGAIRVVLRSPCTQLSTMRFCPTPCQQAQTALPASDPKTPRRGRRVVCVSRNVFQNSDHAPPKMQVLVRNSGPWV